MAAGPRGPDPGRFRRGDRPGRSHWRCAAAAMVDRQVIPVSPRVVAFTTSVASVGAAAAVGTATAIPGKRATNASACAAVRFDTKARQSGPIGDGRQHRRGRAARPQDSDHGVRGNAPTQPYDRALEAADVSIVADEPVLLDPEGVDGADSPSSRRQSRAAARALIACAAW